MSIEFGLYSPCRTQCSDGSVTLEAFNMSTLHRKKLRKIFRTKRIRPSEFKLMEFLDQKFDIPLVEALLQPSYAALKRLIEAGCTIVPMERILTVETVHSLCIAACEHGDLLVLK